MIIALEEDKVLHVYASAAEAAFEVEALDAAETFLAVLDGEGQRYAIRWIWPNVRGWVSARNGEYEFVPSGPLDRAGLLAMLRSSLLVDPPELEASLRALEARLARELEPTPGPGEE